MRRNAHKGLPPYALNVALAIAAGWRASRSVRSPPGFVGNHAQVAALADVGVIFLMFGLGVAFSLKDLARVRAPATIYVGLAFGSLPRLIWKSVMPICRAFPGSNRVISAVLHYKLSNRGPARSGRRAAQPGCGLSCLPRWRTRSRSPSTCAARSRDQGSCAADRCADHRLSGLSPARRARLRDCRRPPAWHPCRPKP
jgi:hypothetical protein